MQPDFSNVVLLNNDEREGFVTHMENATSTNAFIYLIKGRPAFAYGDIHLSPGQRIIADSTGLLWMDGDINVSTGMVGGLIASCMRACSGEPCCLNTYEGTKKDQKVTVGFDLPGDLLSFAVTPGNGWILTATAFVAGSNNLRVSARFSSCCTCLCGDEGIFMTKITVDDTDMGVMLAGGYGMIDRHDVPTGTTLMISRGLFFAARDDTSFEVGLVGKECIGLKNLLCTGGGIVMKFHGPCVVYTQTRNPVELIRQFGGGNLIKVIKIILKIASHASQA